MKCPKCGKNGFMCDSRIRYDDIAVIQAYCFSCGFRRAKHIHMKKEIRDFLKSIRKGATR